MNVSTQASAVTTQVSGAAAIASVSSSKTALSIASSSPDIPAEVVEKASSTIVSADFIGICSFVVMLLSFAWNVYSTHKRDKLDREMKQRDDERQERELRLRELEWDGVNDRRNRRKQQ